MALFNQNGSRTSENIIFDLKVGTLIIHFKSVFFIVVGQGEK